MKLGRLSQKKGGDVATIRTTDTFTSALKEMNSRKIGSLVVLDEAGKVAGILTERDLIINIDGYAKNSPVSEIMTPRAKLILAKPDDVLEYAMSIFTEKRIRHLPVLDGEKLIGIVSIGDTVKELLDAAKEENRHLKDYILGQEIL
ncbi:MAG: CBS domain-containing protein [Spirochaetales bacterium]|nr:CBS domain-containing protein [Spirochaetales bacterium]